MEYSLLKTILPQISNSMPLTPYVRLTSTPSRDLVNPGIGQISRLYSFYTPLPGLHNPFEINKLGESKKINQSGFGDSDEIADNNEKIETTIENDNTLIDELPDNNSLNDGIKESFSYPKIQVKKIIFHSDKKSGITKKASKEALQRKVKNMSIKKHNFNII